MIDRLFFLVMSQLTLGGFLLIKVVSLKDIGWGFFRLCGFLYLLTAFSIVWFFPFPPEVSLVSGQGVLSLITSRWGWEFLLWGIFSLLLGAYNVGIWVERARLSTLSFQLAIAVGIAALLLGAGAYSTASPFWNLPLLALNFLTSALSLGCVMTGMLLGHWYLVTPKLPVAPLRQMITLLLLSLTIQAGAIALSIALSSDLLIPHVEGPGNLLLTTYRPIFLGRVLVGILGGLTIAFFARQALKNDTSHTATQSATGLLFIAILLVMAGEVVARVLLLLTYKHGGAIPI
ncbi:MAG: hypothetical protein HY731_08330 [Candidatus Tectomicrobia bacterium]|nr:hypothetical protein [Candidatus Tectomicrobia bacterium]